MADPGPRKRKLANSDEWDAGRSLRCMLNFIYILAFLCLLRFDEVLRIQWHWVLLERLNDGSMRLKISLPYRKTHQTGGMSQFKLFLHRSP